MAATRCMFVQRPIAMGAMAACATWGAALADPTTLICDNPGGYPIVFNLNEAQGSVVVSSGPYPSRAGPGAFTPDKIATSIADGPLINTYVISRVTVSVEVTQVYKSDNTIAEHLMLSCHVGKAEF